MTAVSAAANPKPIRSSRVQGAQTLARGLHVLEHVAMADARGIGVTELGQLAGLEKSTASRVLATLREAGYVRQDPARRYHITSKLARLAMGYSVSRDVASVAKPILAKLHEQYDEEIHLAVVNGGEMIFLDYVPSSQPVRSNLPALPAPVHQVAVGIAVLAKLDHEQRADVLAEAWQLGGDRPTRAAARQLARAIAEAQERGWADYDAGDDVTRIAVAFTDTTGQPMGAVCLSGPTYRMAGIAEEASIHVRAAADDIAAGLA